MALTKVQIDIFGNNGHHVFGVTSEAHSAMVVNPPNGPASWPAGAIFEMTLFFSDGTRSPLLQWRVESFNTATFTTVLHHVVQIGFRQRCFLSREGVVDWRFQLSDSGGELSDRTRFSASTPTGPDPWIGDPLPDSLVKLRFPIQDGPGSDLMNRTCVWESRELLAKNHEQTHVEAMLAPWDPNFLVYLAERVEGVEVEQNAGNGLHFYPGEDGDDQTLWQPSLYLATIGQRKDASGNPVGAEEAVVRRVVPVGMFGIGSKTVLHSWTANVATRYYDSLAASRGFSLMPGLTPNGTTQENWEILLQVTDTMDLSPFWPTSPVDKQCQWVAEDDNDEDPDTVTAPNVFKTRLDHVRIKDEVSQTVSMTLGAFRRDDGEPVQLGNLTLSSPPKTDGDSYVWSMTLSGYTDRSQQGAQAVRAGSFLLELLPTVAAAAPSTFITEFELVVRARFPLGATNGPKMPIVEIALSPSLPIKDAVPAGEDELDAYQYAQLNVGTPDTCSAGNRDSTSPWRCEIYRNMQHDASIVFRRPTKAPAPQDGMWSLAYKEQSSSREKTYVSMQLLFQGTANVVPDNTQSVLVFSRNPYLFAEVHYHPLDGTQTKSAVPIADWNSVSNEWRIQQYAANPSYLVLPPQGVGEEVVKSNTTYPLGLGDGKDTKLAVGMPAIVTLSQQTRTGSVRAPWDIARLTTDGSLKVSRLDYEILYGMPGTTTAAHMRLTEASAIYGDLLGEFPEIIPPQKSDDPAGYDAAFRYLLARVHWSRIHREYRSRLGVLVVQDSTSDDPETFADAAQATAWLRLRSTKTPNPSSNSPTVDLYTGPSLIPDTMPVDGDGSFHGGALIGEEDRDIYNGIVTVNGGRTPQGNASVINPRFSAEGGFGTVRGAFNYGKTILSDAASMGRTVTYTVEQIGRIACHWNRAKHVIVYERTVVPSRQFYLDQKNRFFGGVPLIRKVEEYVEFLEPERIFANESTAPATCFAHGFKCGERKRIPVDSTWGVVVPGQGWKVPLWNAEASALLPDVYPKPQLFLEVVTPEPTTESTEDRPAFLNADAPLVHPQQAFFYTSYVETNADTDRWKPVETVDYVCYPLLAPDSEAYDSGDLTHLPLPEPERPAGWEAMTFQIAPPAVGVSVTAGVAKTRTPLAAQITQVTVHRGPTPPTVTARTLLEQTSPLQYYDLNARSLATLKQVFADMPSTLAAAATAPDSVKTQASLAAQKTQLLGAANTLKDQAVATATDLQKKTTAPAAPYLAAGSALAGTIKGDIDHLKLLLKKLQDDLIADKIASTAAPTDLAKTAINHLKQTFAATGATALAWTVRDEAQITAIVRIWSGEINAVLTQYAGWLNLPISTLSPLRPVCIAFANFKTGLFGDPSDPTSRSRSLRGKIDALVTQANTDAATFSQAVLQYDHDFDAAISNLTSGLNSLQLSAEARHIDPSQILLLLHTSILSDKFGSAVDQALHAASTRASNDLTAAKTALNAVGAQLDTIKGNLDSITGMLNESTFDLLRGVPKVTELYNVVNDANADIAKLKALVQKTCDAPADLIQSFSATADALLTQVGDATQNALKGLAETIGSWLQQQGGAVFGQMADLVNAINGLPWAGDLKNLQDAAATVANQYRGAMQQIGHNIDQYVRQPLLDAYREVAPTGDQAIRLLRAFGSPPTAPHLDLRPPAVGYLYAEANKKIPVTAMLARANQVGQALNALGVSLPTTALGESLIPAALQKFKLSDVLPNFAGLQLPGLFSGIHLPAVNEKAVTVTQGFEPQSRRAWLQADVNIPFADRMVVFSAGFATFVLTKATFTARSRVQNSGTAIEQSTQGSITGTWSIEIGDSTALISFANTMLSIDDRGKFHFQFRPEDLTLSDAMKAISALLKGFGDPNDGFSVGPTPNGVKCAFVLPVPDSSAVTSGFTGLRFGVSMELNVAKGFSISLALSVSSKDRPFNFAIFILGGCGYLTASVTYADGKMQAPELDLAIGCSASLAIALGPISGGVYAQFAIELRNTGAGFRTGAFFQITGHVSICGIISVDLVFRLEASYADAVMTASGHFRFSVSFFMFSFTVERDISMSLGRNGQQSSAIPRAGELREVATLDAGGLAMADAFFGRPPDPAESAAARYVYLLT